MMNSGHEGSSGSVDAVLSARWIIIICAHFLDRDSQDEKMNGATRPMSASASVSEKPIHM